MNGNSTKSSPSSKTFSFTLYDSQFLPFLIFLHIVGNFIEFFSVRLCTESSHISQECLHGFYERLKELLCNRKDSFLLVLHGTVTRGNLFPCDIHTFHVSVMLNNLLSLYIIGLFFMGMIAKRWRP